MKRFQRIPQLSVVVCTNRPAPRLMPCVQSLLEQNAAGESYEVIIVDNSPTEEASSRLRRAVDRRRVRYLREKRPGLSRARNLGWRAARGSLIAFLDDDALANHDWATSICRAFQEYPGADCVGGRVQPRFEGQVPGWLGRRQRAVLSLLDWSPTARELHCDEWLVGTNIAFRRPALEAVGGFPESLGRQRSNLLSMEEQWVLDRLRQTGKLLVYDPRVAVEHCIGKERLRRRWMLRRFFYQGLSEGLIQSAAGTPRWSLVSRSLGDAHAEALAWWREGGSWPECPRSFTHWCRIAQMAGKLSSLIPGKRRATARSELRRRSGSGS